MQKLAHPVPREACVIGRIMAGRLPARLDYATDFDRARAAGT
jgi:hypothetical protein